MSRHDEIKNAYQSLGGKATFYDGMITCSTLPGRAVCKLVWNMGKAENAAYLEQALSGIPDDFAGRLLEVPVGTGVLTMPVYRALPATKITCLDYSPEMMERARRRAPDNVSFVQGDVGRLPFADESFDIVLSLNGFHAFPDKEAAYAETFRVLKRGGVFCGCFSSSEDGYIMSGFSWNSSTRGLSAMSGRTLKPLRRREATKPCRNTVPM